MWRWNFQCTKCGAWTYRSDDHSSTRPNPGSCGSKVITCGKTNTFTYEVNCGYSEGQVLSYTITYQ